MLQIEALDVEFRAVASARARLHPVRRVSFDVRSGETISLVGESGSGKTLTALAIMGLLPRNAFRRAARMRFRDLDLLTIGRRELTRLRGRAMGMIFQDPMTSLNPVYTIGSQLTEVFVARGLGTRRQAEERAHLLLERVEIPSPSETLTQYPHQLSGGMRQRVMIAMALMCSPALLIADEPTTALDVTIQAQVLRLLKTLKTDLNLALILITHDMGVVANVADRVCVMYGGQIVETGPVSDVFHRPLHPYTAGLLACVPTPGRTRSGEPLSAIPGIVPLVTTETTGCGFGARCPYVEERCRGAEIPLVPVPGPARHLHRCLVDPFGAPAVGHDRIDE